MAQLSTQGQNGTASTFWRSERGIGMAEKHGAIRFGDWELRPRDKLNWELFRFRERRSGASSGEMVWASEERFYQWNTFESAVVYAADVELKEGCEDGVVELAAALEERDRILKALIDEFVEALNKDA